MDRRSFLIATGAGVTVTACGRDPAPTPAAIAEPVPAVPIASDLIRVASVKTAVEGGLLPVFVKLFEASHPYRVKVTTGEAVYNRARGGLADLVVSHFGHRDAEAFVLEGLGEWPRTVFSNQMALLGPTEDPAGIRGLDDVGEAFHRIAAAKAPFVLNDIDGVRYLSEILRNAAGKPDRTGWFIDDAVSRGGAIDRAAKVRGYTLWGLTPFLRTTKDLPTALEALVVGDPLLQRMLVSVIVKPGANPTNVEGARAFQTYLLSPSTQAAIRTIHYPGAMSVAWVPGGRHNRSAMLPRTG